MICKEVQELFLDKNLGELMIPAENVANVNCNNNLYHAFLVLSKVKYQVIPVLDNASRIKGLISMPMIMNAIMDVETMHYDRLESLTVEEVMDKSFPFVYPWMELEDILNRLVDANFLCVIKHDGEFQGIITRKEILSRLNFLMHELHHRYDLTYKNLAQPI